MANYSKEELQYIASQVQPYLLELVKSNGLDVDSIEVVEDTDGITSLPAYDNRGGVKKVVRVPLSTFAKPAQDAADSLAESIAKADAAAENANAAAENANGVLDEIDSIKADIEKAVEDAQKALDEVQEAAATVTEKVDEINASEGAREEAEQARQEAETARVTEYGDLKNQMNAALVDMDTATESALDTANHPTYVGENNYVYIWDKSKKVYVKTDIYVKGDDGVPGPQGPQGEKGEKGENGSGSGNVLVSVDGLVKGKTYLFTPSQNGSAEGTFVEYEVPQIDTSEIATKAELEDKADRDEIPSKVSQLENDAQYATPIHEGEQSLSFGVSLRFPFAGSELELNTTEKNYYEDTSLELSYDKYGGILENTVAGAYVTYRKINGATSRKAGFMTASDKAKLDGIDLSTKQDKVMIVDHGTEDTAFELTPNILHRWGTVSSLTLTLAAPSDTTEANYYMFEFTSGPTATTLSLPDTIAWANVVSIEANKKYQVSILNGCGIIGGF